MVRLPDAAEQKSKQLRVYTRRITAEHSIIWQLSWNAILQNKINNYRKRLTKYTTSSTIEVFLFEKNKRIILSRQSTVVKRTEVWSHSLETWVRSRKDTRHIT